MPTLTAYRRALLEEIGGGGVYVATASGAANGSTVVCSAAFTSSPLPSDHLGLAWIHVPSITAPKQQRITATGLNPANGTITVGNGFGAQVTSAMTFEISARIALVDGSEKSPGLSLNQCVNLALRHLLVPDEISVAITTSDEISLATWQWLDRADRLRGVLEPSPVAGRAAIDAAWRVHRAEDGNLLTLDAELPKLRLNAPFSTATGNLTLQALRPAHTWIKSSGTWAEDADGLGAEADEAKPELDDVVMAAKPFVYWELARRTSERQAEYQGLYEQTLAEARALRYWDSTRDKLPSRAQDRNPPEAA